MIRWRFILTRLIIVAAIVMLLRMGLGPVARFVTVRGLQQTSGARVDIAKTKVGLFPPRIEYQDVHIADPRDGKEMRDAIVADTIELVIDGEALMHRRWVARDGRITGLKIGSQREDSGRLESEPASASDASEPSILDRLVGGASGQVADVSDQMLEASETVRRGKQIRLAWERKYEDLEDRAKNLEAKIRRISQQAKGIDNPLRDLPQWERTLKEVSETRDELVAVRQEIDSLPEQLQSDLASLDEAKQIDLAKVDEYVPGDLVGASEFGVDVFAESIRAKIAEVKSYLDGGRTLANYTVVAPDSDRQRGVDHDLDKLDRPELLIRRCEVGGVLRSGGDLYEMTGVVENMTPSPERLVEPTRARLTLEGPESLRVDYVRDRRNNADVDLLTLHWPEFDSKSLEIGGSDSAIAIDGGRRELWISIRTEGDQLSGRLVSKQVGVNVGLKVDPKYSDLAGVRSLQNSLADVDRVEMDARFEGTWDDIDLDLSTNLGQVLKRASQDAVASQVAQSKAKLAKSVNRAHADQTIQLRRWISERSGQARELMASADKAIEEMSRKVMTEVSDAEELLGSRLRSAVMGKLR